MRMKIALIGNPNSGKTTLFNALTGSNQSVGNWPGVTVEKKEGKLKYNKDVTIIDLPGIYSLSPYTLEEVVSRNYLLTEKPDIIINIVDGTNLERNLYLSTQLLELSIPMIVAVNMMDVVNKNGDIINTKQLAKSLGCQVLEISAMKGIGVEELAKEVLQLQGTRGNSTIQKTFAHPVEEVISFIEESVQGMLPIGRERWYAIKLFERDEKVLEELQINPAVKSEIEGQITKLEDDLDDDSESIITNERYQYITRVIENNYKKRNKNGLTTSDKIDRVVTNRFWALPIFVSIMFVVYYISVTSVGTIMTDFTNDVLFGEWIIPSVASFLEGINTALWLQGLLVDGIVGGVGAVLGFVPQIFVLFILLAILEECGYMARVAFVLDRIFRKFGLSGKSFIPMLISTGCGIPGVLSSRTIENERDRRMTIMTTTFMPCGAKLPIIALISGALFDGKWWVAPSAYFVGIAAIIVSGIMLKKTSAFSGAPAPFVMELPAYHMPLPGSVLRSMWERGWSFIKKAGTVILLSAIFIWFASAYGFEKGTFGVVENYESSILGYIGSAIAWIFTPLGFGNAKAAVAALLGLVAKENVVTTFGILYGFAEVAENGSEFWPLLQAEYSALAGYAFLVFNLLCAPCFAAIGAIKREMNNTKWTWFAILYQTGLAYVVALMIYQFGMLFTGNANILGVCIAAVILLGMLYMLFRPYKEVNTLKTEVRIK